MINMLKTWILNKIGVLLRGESRPKPDGTPTAFWIEQRRSTWKEASDRLQRDSLCGLPDRLPGKAIKAQYGYDSRRRGYRPIAIVRELEDD